ncbi:hypothetical protein [Pseudomonas sp. 58 R 3]|nr:hypothetical protein [Pseudomonas sp. 58 R 3]
MQRAQQHIRAITQGVGQLLIDPANLGLPGQKHQNAARLVLHRVEDGLHHARLDKLTGLVRPPPAHLHREHAPFAAQDRRVVQQTRQALAFEGGGHQQDFQRLLVAKQLAAVEAQGQCQVGVEAAFVELVKNQQPHAVQCRVVLQPARENAFGDHFDAGVGPDFAVQADAVADGFTDFFTQLTGQAFGSRSRGEAPRFEHQDGLPGQPRLI